MERDSDKIVVLGSKALAINAFQRIEVLSYHAGIVQVWHARSPAICPAQIPGN